MPNTDAIVLIVLLVLAPIGMALFISRRRRIR